MCRKGWGINLLTCFNIDLYRDALCKIGNEMHDDHRYSQLSPCAHARRQYEHQLNSLSTAGSCFLTRTLTCGPDGSCTSSVEAVFRLLGLEFLWEINVQFNEIPVTCVCFLESMTIAHWHVGVILLTSRIV